METERIKELPEHERPRERLAERGAAALSDAELIGILINTGIPGSNAVQLGRQLLVRFGSLAGLSRASVAELESLRGIGPAKAVHLAAAFGLASRLAREEFARRKVDSPAHVLELLGAEMRALPKESLRVILLDPRLHLIRVHEVSLGTTNEAIAHPRDILHAAITHSAYAFILAHNHPSGDPMPSDADHRLTRRLAEACSLLQIKLLDHVIIGAPSPGHAAHFSFREAGVI